MQVKMASLVFAMAMRLLFVIAGQAALIQEQAMPEADSGKIQGVVVDSQGAAFPGVGVTITHQANHTEYSQRTNASGKYDFTNLPSGKYDVLLKAPPTPVPYKMFKILSVEVVDGKATDLESRMRLSDVSDPVEGFVLHAPPPTSGDISGVVLDDLGAGMSGADVTLLIAPASSLERRTKTDSEGAYRFVDLRPGKYEVQLSGKGLCAKTVSAKVAAGKTTKLKTRLKPGPPSCGTK